MAEPHVLVGTWNYVNETVSKCPKTMDGMSMSITGQAISGKIVYSKYGDFHLTVPNKSSFGDYKLEGS